MECPKHGAGGLGRRASRPYNAMGQPLRGNGKVKVAIEGIGAPAERHSHLGIFTPSVPSEIQLNFCIPIRFLGTALDLSEKQSRYQ